MQLINTQLKDALLWIIALYNIENDTSIIKQTNSKLSKEVSGKNRKKWFRDKIDAYDLHKPGSTNVGKIQTLWDSIEWLKGADFAQTFEERLEIAIVNGLHLLIRSKSRYEDVKKLVYWRDLETEFSNWNPQVKNISDEKKIQTLLTKFVDILLDNWGYKAQNCVLINYPKFLRYDIHFTKVETAQKKSVVPNTNLPLFDHSGNLVYKNDGQPLERSNATMQKDEPPTSTKPEYFMAVYLSSTRKTLFAKVELVWGKNELKTKRWPLRSTLTQYDPDNLTTPVVFESLEPIKYAESNISYIAYIQYLGISDEKINIGRGDFEQKFSDIAIQCTVSLNKTSREIILGTFSSITGKNFVFQPLGGTVILTKCSRDEYRDLEKRVIDVGESNKGIREKYLFSQYYVNDKLTLPTEFLYKGLADFPFYESWKTYQLRFTGRYQAIIMHMQKGGVWQTAFEIHAREDGSCIFQHLGSGKGISATNDIQGIVWLDKFTLLFSFEEFSGEVLNYLRIYMSTDPHLDEITGEKFYVGTYIGSFPKLGIETFQSGMIRLSHTATNTNKKESIFQKTLQIEKGNKFSSLSLDHYTDAVSSSFNGIPDSGIFNKIFRNHMPIEHNDYKKLEALDLYKHYKYFTMRVPEEIGNNKGTKNTYRIEKCDLVFDDDFRTAKIIGPGDRISSQKIYEGNVFYNGRVLLLLMTETGRSMNDRNYNYFTLQIHHHLDTEAKGRPEVLLGTSTWEEYHLESKMIVLIRPNESPTNIHINSQRQQTQPGNDVDRFEIDQFGRRTIDDCETHIYYIGTERNFFNKEQYEAILLQDRNYRGAVSFLLGKINRHIQVTSKPFEFQDDIPKNKTDSTATKVLRPRFSYNREPYMYAALHIAKQIDTIGDENQKIILREKAEQYLFEAFLHQYAPISHAGVTLSDDSIKALESAQNENDFTKKLRTLLKEQDYLRIEYEKIGDDILKRYMCSLWTYLDKKPETTNEPK